MENKKNLKPVPRLQLVANFNKEQYPYFIDVKIGYNPETSGSDFMYQYDPEYKEFKFQSLPRHKEQSIKHTIEKLGIKDYFIFRNYTLIQIFFKKIEDHILTLASIAPQHSFTVDFFHCAPGMSKKQIRLVARELKAALKDTDISSDIKFQIDNERRIIKAVASNGNSFVKFWKQSESLRNSPGFLYPVKNQSFEPKYI